MGRTICGGVTDGCPKSLWNRRLRGSASSGASAVGALAWALLMNGRGISKTRLAGRRCALWTTPVEREFGGLFKRQLQRRGGPASELGRNTYTFRSLQLRCVAQWRRRPTRNSPDLLNILLTRRCRRSKGIVCASRETTAARHKRCSPSRLLRGSGEGR